MGGPSADPEPVVMVAGGGAARGSDRGSFLPQTEAAPAQASYLELEGLRVTRGRPSQPPGLVALGLGSGNRSRTSSGMQTSKSLVRVCFGRICSACQMLPGDLEKSYKNIFRMSGRLVPLGDE